MCMRDITARSVSFISCAAIIITMVALIWSHSSTTAGYVGQKKDVQEKLEIKFSKVESGSGQTLDGIKFSDHLFESSDGIGLSVTIEDRILSEQAIEELQRTLKEAEKIIEQGPKFNANGEQVGERAVLLFAPNKPYRD